MLARHFPVSARRFTAKTWWRHAWSQASQALWLLGRLPSADLVFAWFADWHVLVPVLLGRLAGKRVLVVVGGYDAARLPELGYGAHLSPLRSRCSRIVLRRASLLLPVSRATLAEMDARGPHAPARVVPNGVDASLFRPLPGTRRDIGLFTLCGASDRRAALVKGIDRFLAAARLLPGTPCLAAGLEGEATAWVRSLGVPSNVELRGRICREDLPGLYARSRVYAQFSRHESFGVALAEAMASGCLPVVTAVGGMPEVVGDEGWVVDGDDPGRLAAAVREALGAGDERRSGTRRRVVEHFSAARREATLVSLVEGGTGISAGEW